MSSRREKAKMIDTTQIEFLVIHLLTMLTRKEKM